MEIYERTIFLDVPAFTYSEIPKRELDKITAAIEMDVELQAAFTVVTTRLRTIVPESWDAKIGVD